MKFYTTLPLKLKPFFYAELEDYAAELAVQNMVTAWKHLERAHILGQKYPIAHTLVHWKMLRFGFLIKSRKEIVGQIPRLMVGGVKSFVGSIPLGNPGGANVPPMKPFPIEQELQNIFQMAEIKMN